MCLDFHCVCHCLDCHCVCHALRHSEIVSWARKQILMKFSMDLPESIIKQYVVSPQPLNYPPAKSCTSAKKVNLVTSSYI